MKMFPLQKATLAAVLLNEPVHALMSLSSGTTTTAEVRKDNGEVREKIDEDAGHGAQEHQKMEDATLAQGESYEQDSDLDHLEHESGAQPARRATATSLLASSSAAGGGSGTFSSFLSTSRGGSASSSNDLDERNDEAASGASTNTKPFTLAASSLQVGQKNEQKQRSLTLPATQLQASTDDMSPSTTTSESDVLQQEQAATIDVAPGSGTKPFTLAAGSVASQSGVVAATTPRTALLQSGPATTAAPTVVPSDPMEMNKETSARPVDENASRTSSSSFLTRTLNSGIEVEHVVSVSMSVGPAVGEPASPRLVAPPEPESESEAAEVEQKQATSSRTLSSSSSRAAMASRVTFLVS